MKARVWVLVFSLWSSVCLFSDLQVFPNDDSVRCGGIDGGNGHLFPLGYQACVFCFKGVPNGAVIGVPGFSAYGIIVVLSLFPSSSPISPFLLVAQPDAERNCPSLRLLYTSLRGRGGEYMDAWLFLCDSD